MRKALRRTSGGLDPKKGDIKRKELPSKEGSFEKKKRRKEEGERRKEERRK